MGLTIFVACSTKEYKFVPDPKPPHCENGAHDEDLGETDEDCGGEDCRGCGLGQGCLETSDCIEGECLEDFCQLPGCDNGAQDEGETGTDCGGSCKPCGTGEPCVVATDCASRVCAEDGTCAEPACDDGIRNGTETDRDCGGLCPGCGTGSPCNEDEDCASLLCSSEAPSRCEVMCPEGKAECDGDLDEECETNVLTDPLHCDGCGETCELANAVQSCVSGTCQIGSCESPWDDCDNESDNGCETNLRTTVSDCGACGNDCSDDNGTPSCEGGECQIECDEGWADCDDDRANGCEKNIAGDVLACGDCTTECPFDDGETPFCADGECGATVCPDGFGNCDGMGDSCEQDLTSDPAHCLRCGGTCTVQHGTPSCSASGCGVDGCEDGWANCDEGDDDGGYADGCETNTNVDVANCGACGNDCSVANGMATCVDGECRVMSCSDGWFNCDSGNSDGGYANGCETNISADKTNCGVCGRNCDALLASANATGRCEAGICVRDQCLPNFGDCDSNPANCESDFRSDEGDCGMCGTMCSPTGTTGSPGNECSSSTCTPTCATTHRNCDGEGQNGCEIDIRSNNSHCGGCNAPCATGRTCSNGTCVCTGGLTSCSGNCVNTQTSNTHCGMCGNACTGGRTCVSGVCQCPSGQTFCGTTCVDTDTSDAHCGQCNRACQEPTGTTSNACSDGDCEPICATLRGDCDLEPWDGCETNLASNDDDCGVCGRSCDAVNGTNSCNSSGACVPSCSAGFANCDSEPWDGCETDITTVTNCGACGVDCAGSSCGATGSTSCCVQSGSSRACQAQVTIPANGDVDGSVNGSTLNSSTGSPPLGALPAHNLQSGTNRLVLVAVAAERGGGGVAGARPSSVTYGGTAMLVGPEQSGGTDFFGPDLFFYYLTDGSGLSGTGSRSVVISGMADSIIANVIQFNGVRQSSPISASQGGSLASTGGNCHVTHAPAVATTGSVIYSLSGAVYAGTNPANVHTTSLPLTARLSMTGTLNAELRAYAGHTALPSALTGPSTPTVGWTWPWCSVATHLAVVIHPAQQ